MLEIIETIVAAFTGIISGFTDGISTATSNLLFVTSAEGERVLTDFAKFGLTFIGLGMAIGIVYFVVGLIRN